jgi:hypothetical protein
MTSPISMCDDSTEAIIKAIREEIWANNQMQLAAFYANQQPLAPPPPPKASPPPPHPDDNMALFIALLIVLVLFCVAWFALLCMEVVKRSTRRMKMKAHGDRRLNPLTGNGASSRSNDL